MASAKPILRFSGMNSHTPFQSFARLLAVTGMLAVSGCAMNSVSIDKAVPDTANITGSVTPAQPEDTKADSDKLTVRNIVSALNFTQWGKKPIPWANPDTGSQGTITTVAEKKNEAGLCREFQTSKESFEGVMLYQGETCMNGDGQWVLKSFSAM